MDDYQGDATRCSGPHYDTILHAGTEKAFYLREVHLAMALRRQRDLRNAHTAASLSGTPRPPDPDALSELELQLQEGAARIANMWSRQRGASLSGSSSGGGGGGGGGGGVNSSSGGGGGGGVNSSSRGVGGVSSGSHGRGAGCIKETGRGSGGPAGTAEDLEISAQRHAAVEVGWKRLRSSSVSGRIASGGSSELGPRAGLHRIDLSTAATSVAAVTSRSPAVSPVDLSAATARPTKGPDTPPSKILVPAKPRIGEDSPSAAVEGEEEEEEEEGEEGEEKEEEEVHHWVPPPPSPFSASVCSRSLLDSFSFTEDRTLMSAAVNNRGQRGADHGLRRSVSSSDGGHGGREKPLLELREAFSSVCHGSTLVSSSSGGPAATRQRLSQSGTGPSRSDDDGFFMLPRNTYHRRRTQSLSGATPPKDTLMARAAAIGGGTLHEKMKEHIRCTQPLSGITIAEEDTAPDYCDLPPAFTAPAHPLSAFATATAAAAAAASDGTGMMGAVQSPNTATPPRDMLSARRRQRSCSCSGGGGAGDAHTSGGVHILGDVHTFMAHHIPSPKGISCCSEEASGLCGHATPSAFHTSPVHTNSAQATTPPCIDSSYRRQRRGFSCSGAAAVHTSYVHTAASPLGTATSMLKQFLMEKCASDNGHLMHAEDGASIGGGGGYKAAEHSRPAPPAPMLPTPPHFPHPPAASRGISSGSGSGGAALSPRLPHAAAASRGGRGVKRE